MLQIAQPIDLSLTENLVPAVVHAKQYDNMGRKVVCTIYSGSTQVNLDEDIFINVSGTRSDGAMFQYSSDMNSDTVYVENGKAIIWITSVMTGSSGRTAVDVTITDGEGCSIGTFSFILSVAKASLQSEGLSTGSYSSLLSSLSSNLVNCYIDTEGYLILVSDDDFNLSYKTDNEVNLTVSNEGGDGS